MLGHTAPMGTNEFDIVIDIDKIKDLNPHHDDPDLIKIDDLDEKEQNELQEVIDINELNTP